MSEYPASRGHRFDLQRGLRLGAFAAVVAGVVLLASAAFVLSYAGIHHIALQAGVPPALARLYPLIFDAMLVIAAAAALALRDAGWWARGYVWLCLLVLLAAVAAGDAIHAMNVALPRQPSRAAVAITPWALVLLAFGLWLAMLRHLRKLRAAKPPTAARPAVLASQAAGQPDGGRARPVARAAIGSGPAGDRGDDRASATAAYDTAVPGGAAATEPAAAGWGASGAGGSAGASVTGEPAGAPAEGDPARGGSAPEAGPYPTAQEPGIAYHPAGHYPSGVGYPGQSGYSHHLVYEEQGGYAGQAPFGEPGYYPESDTDPGLGEYLQEGYPSRPAQMGGIRYEHQAGGGGQSSPAPAQPPATEAAPAGATAPPAGQAPPPAGQAQPAETGTGSRAQPPGGAGGGGAASAHEAQQPGDEAPDGGDRPRVHEQCPPDADEPSRLPAPSPVPHFDRMRSTPTPPQE